MDLTNVKDGPARWKYCEECCQKMGIDFDSQTPSQGISEKEKERRKLLSGNSKRRSKQNIKS